MTKIPVLNTEYDRVACDPEDKTAFNLFYKDEEVGKAAIIDQEKGIVTVSDKNGVVDNAGSKLKQRSFADWDAGYKESDPAEFNQFARRLCLETAKAAKLQQLKDQTVKNKKPFFKKLSAQEALGKLQSKVKNAKRCCLRCAGKKGMLKAKLTLCQAAASVSRKLNTAAEAINDANGAVFAVLGGSMVGIGMLSGLSIPEMWTTPYSSINVLSRTMMSAGALGAAAPLMQSISQKTAALAEKKKTALKARLAEMSPQTKISPLKGQSR